VEASAFPHHRGAGAGTAGGAGNCFLIYFVAFVFAVFFSCSVPVL
jgi:hypothetical protein